MRVLVPFAAGRSEAALAALGTLDLPHLAAFLGDGEVAWRDEGPLDTLSPPHERALGRMRGWRGPDGALPFAAADLRGLGHDAGSTAWLALAPVHWQLGREHALLTDPSMLELDGSDAAALWSSLRELFTSTGFRAVDAGAGRWFVGRDDLEALPAASIDRAVGLPVSHWLARPETKAHAASRTLKRLTSEAQLVLHAHPVNDAREAAGLPSVNALWLHGAGREQPFDAARDPAVDARLRTPFLAADWTAWAESWTALDAGPIAALHGAAQAGRSAELVLCGERAAVAVEGRRRSWAQRAWRAVAGARVDAVALLDGL